MTPYKCQEIKHLRKVVKSGNQIVKHYEIGGGVKVAKETRHVLGLKGKREWKSEKDRESEERKNKNEHT